MQRWTHLVFAALLFVGFNFILHMPLYFSLFAFIGAIIPDMDIGFMHRKLLHNIWALAVMLILGFKFGLMDRAVAIAFSLGFFSHLASDALTHMGVMPLWPITRPKIHGPIKTGGLGEFLVLATLLFVLFNIGRFLV
ncbi:MAG: metal-dependent hydrolase [Candidatus Aenigmatarchaeota archaeon]